MESSNRGTDAGHRVFFVPASGKEAQAHLRVSLTQPISVDVRQFIGERDAGIADDEGQHFAWAAKPGPRNDKTWASMQPGDYVIFYSQGLYSYIATVKLRIQNADLAEALWGHGDDGSRWELIYFVTHPIRIDIPLENLADVFQSAPYQGFVELSDARAAAIEAEYGTIDDFISQRIFKQVANFTLIRSNAESAWEDIGAEAYHYGRTVANYKTLRIGTAAVFDRKQNGTVVIYAYGRVTDIRQREDGTFDAHFDYNLLEPRPYTSDELALLRAQPGYNVQHSIRPISSELYNRLTGLETRTQSPMIDDISPELIAAKLSWSIERAVDLIDLVKRTRSLLLAGPPGTGKTFLAKVIADAITTEPAQQRIIQFHPAYQYEDFIEGIRPVLAGTTLSYEMHRGVLLSIAARAAAQPDFTYVLILDELNRGNIARIFGELIYSIEYRGQENALTLASGETFYMPHNLLIIATMNTADRSITGMDAALRRRFRQLYLGPDLAALEAYLTKSINAETALQMRERLERLNRELLGIHGDSGKLVGHTYFMQRTLTPADLDQIWNEQLEPLIGDYLFDRPEELTRLKAIFGE